MMRFLKVLFFFVLCVLLESSPAFCGGIFVDPGARACGLGGAFTGVADDLTAVFYNPAGLTQLSGTNVMLSGFYINTPTKSNESVLNSATPNVPNDGFPAVNLYSLVGGLTGNSALANIEPAQYGSKEMNVLSFLPFAAGSFQIDSKDVLAVSFYGMGGGGGRWDDTSASNVPGDYIHAMMQAVKGFMIGNVSFARQFDQKLALGLNYVDMIDQTTFAKQYNAVPNNPYHTLSYSQYGDYNASGGGIEGVIGALYKINEKSQVGFTYRSGAALSLTGKATGVTTGFGALTGGLAPDGTVTTNYTEKYNYPMTLSLGYSYRPITKLLLSFEAEYINYKALRNETTYDTTNQFFFVNSDADAHWQDEYRYHAGAEYTLSRAWKVRAGLSNDSDVYNFDEKTLLDTFMYNLMLLDTGIGYTIGSFSVNIDVTTSFSNQPEIDGRTYEFPGNGYRFDLAYRY